MPPWQRKVQDVLAGQRQTHVSMHSPTILTGKWTCPPTLSAWPGPLLALLAEVTASQNMTWPEIGFCCLWILLKTSGFAEATNGSLHASVHTDRRILGEGCPGWFHQGCTGRRSLETGEGGCKRLVLLRRHFLWQRGPFYLTEIAVAGAWGLGPGRCNQGQCQK